MASLLRVRKSLLIEVCFLLLLSVPYFYKLGLDYTNVDQDLWLTRSQNFYQAIGSLKFSETYQQYHPGVTLMYLVGFGQQIYGVTNGGFVDWKQVTYDKFSTYNFYTKLPVVTVVFLTLCVCYFALKQLSNNIAAMFFMLLLSTEPFFLANARNLHLDSLLSAFSLASVLFLLLFFQKKSTSYILISAGYLGLALLTKSPSVLLIPFFTSTLIMMLVFKRIDLQCVKKSLVTLFFVGFSVFFVAFPAMWVHPIGVLREITVSGVVDTGVKTGHNHYIQQKRIRNPGPTYYFNVLKYRISPLVLLLFFGGLILVFRDLKSFKILKLVSLAFIIIYMLCFSFLLKKTDRYIMPILPYLYLITSLGISSLFLKVKQRISYKATISLFFTVFASIQVITLAGIFPHLFAYYSPLFGGISSAKKEIYLNQGGTGLIEVAKFLNAQNIDAGMLVGTFEPDVLRYWSKYQLTTLSPFKYKKYEYEVLPLQRGAEYTKGYKKVFSITIQNQEYWKVYQREYKNSVPQ